MHCPLLIGLARLAPPCPGFHMGVFGAALATTLSQYLSCSVLCGQLLRKGTVQRRHLMSPPSWDFVGPMLRAGSMLAVRNIASFGECNVVRGGGGGGGRTAAGPSPPPSLGIAAYHACAMFGWVHVCVCVCVGGWVCACACVGGWVCLGFSGPLACSLAAGCRQAYLFCPLLIIIIYSCGPVLTES